MLRYRQSVPFSIQHAVQQFDAVSPGLLGGLLSQLNRGAKAHAPLFTPEDLLDNNPYGTPVFERDNTLYEAQLILRKQYAALPPEALAAKLAQLTFRDAARLAARNGQLTERDDHRLGYTLGRNLPHLDELNARIATLPPDLRSTAQKFRCITRALEHLEVEAGAFDYDRFEDYGSEITPAFLITPHAARPPRTHPDLFLEQWQEHAELNWNSWEDDYPLFCVELNDPDLLPKLVRVIRTCSRALLLIRQALLLLGAVPVEFISLWR
ncbi:hypothetical protein [Deinococcus ruber]|nr:hypothetical protein [Deinococcus ruber]